VRGGFAPENGFNGRHEGRPSRAPRRPEIDPTRHRDAGAQNITC
jgi:hypothetical protein